MSQGIHYRLNERDEIVFVNEAWDAFASTNASEHLSGSRVLGHPLWSFITDPTTRVLYGDVLARVRGGYPVRLVLRCDSPDCRRLLEMDVSGAAGGLTEFRVRVLSEEPRQPQPLLDPHRPRSEQLLRVCGWCKKVDVGDRWADVEEAVSVLGLFEQSSLPGVTHGICEDCYLRTVATLNEDKSPAEQDAAEQGRWLSTHRARSAE